MGVISFSDSREGTWHVARWAFDQILDDVNQYWHDDTEIVETLEQGKLHSGLILYTLDPLFANRICRAIAEVIIRILNNSVRSGLEDQPYGDAVAVEQYRRALMELLHLIRKATEKPGLTSSS